MKSSSEMRLRALASWALRSTGFALLGDLPGGAVVFGHDERVASSRDPREALHEHGTARVGLVDRFAVLVMHRTDAPVGRSGDDRVADAQRSVLDEHGRNGAAALVELRFDRDTAGIPGRGWP